MNVFHLVIEAEKVDCSVPTMCWAFMSDSLFFLKGEEPPICIPCKKSLNDYGICFTALCRAH